MKTLLELVRALGDEVVTTLGDLNVPFEGVSTDTRTIAPGNVFFAFTGERFNAVTFAGRAVEAGAVALVYDHSGDARPETDVPQIVVKNAERAYALAAKAHRQRFTLPLAMVVGSNGKTTTTQMLAGVLKAALTPAAVLATQGNLNNEIGVPHMLWRLSGEHKAAVIEAGMNKPGEMARLTDVIRPTVVLVTNAQREHQEFLAGVRESARENGIAIVGLTDSGTAVYPADDKEAPVWQALALARGVKAMTYSTDPAVKADVFGRAADGVLTIQTAKETFSAPFAVAGEHNVHNAVGVAAAALAMGLTPQAVVNGLGAFRALPGRGARCNLKNGTLMLIDDAYNANPDSVKASMRMLCRETLTPRTFVLGDMGEVGETAPEVHREVGAYAAALGIDRLVTCGRDAALAAEAFGKGAEHYGDVDAVTAALSGVSGTVVVKASHFMGFERIVQALKAQ